MALDFTQPQTEEDRPDIVSLLRFLNPQAMAPQRQPGSILNFRESANIGAPRVPERSVTPIELPDPMTGHTSGYDPSAPRFLNFGGAAPIDPTKPPAPPEPQRSDYQAQIPQTRLGKLMRALETAGVSLVGGYKAGRDFWNGPRDRAEQEYEQAHADWAGEQGRQRQAQADDLSRRNVESEIALRGAETDRAENPPQTRTAAKPDVMETPEGPVQWNGTGWDPVMVNGKRVGPKESIAPDTNKVNPIVEAEVGPRPDPKNYAGGANDQKYRADSLAWGNKAEAVMNRMARLAGEARGAGYNATRPVEVLDTWNGNRPVRVSAQEQEDNPGRYVNQLAGVHALTGQVTADDIQGAIENLRGTTGVLNSMSPAGRTVMEAILSDPKTNVGNLAQNVAAKNLSPEQQDYVIAILTAREVIPGLRNLLGTGQATDARVKNMLETLPSARTADSAMANRQLDAILGTLKRVRPAIPNVRAQGEATGGRKTWNAKTGRYE